MLLTPVFSPLVAAAGPVVLTYEDNGNNDDNTSSNSYGTLNIGAAASDRVVLVAVTAKAEITGIATTSVSIAGANGTKVAGYGYNSGGGTSVLADFYARLVTAGTTGNITVNYSGSVDRSGVNVYSMTGSGGLFTAHDDDGYTGPSSSGAPSGTINVPAGGAALGITSQNQSGGYEWTGLSTEDYDAAMGATTMSGASQNFSTAQTNLTITADFSGSGQRTAFAVVSFSPG